MESLKAFFLYSSEEGLRLPAAFDKTTSSPSITLLAVHITFWITVYLLLKDPSSSFWGALAFWAIANVFYLIRKITKFKLDADDKSIELEGENEESTDK